MIIKLDKIANTTIPNENMVQIGSRTNIYHKFGQNYRHNNIASKCMVQIGSLIPTFFIKLDRITNTTISKQNVVLNCFMHHQFIKLDTNL